MEWMLVGLIVVVFWGGLAYFLSRAPRVEAADPEEEQAGRDAW